MACFVAEIGLRFTKLVRNVGPSFTAYDAEYGKRLKKSFNCKRYSPEFTMMFSTNSLGFRGPEQKGSTKHGIVFLGDSFTMGYGVSDGEEFPRLLGEQLSSEMERTMPIVNMGMGNNGNGRWLKFLRKEVGKYDPKLIVMQFCGNDFGDNDREGLFLHTGADGLVEKPVPKISQGRRLNQIAESIPGLSYSYLFCFIKQAVLDRHQSSGADEGPTEAIPTVTKTHSDKENLTYALVEEALTTADSQGWPVVILSVANEPSQNKELAARCQKHGLDLIVIPERDERSDLYYTTDGHWTPAGHRYVAEALAEAIRARKLLDAE